MSTLERAFSIAVEAHAGQKDKANAPYILHVLRVAASLPLGDAQVVAMLHDVVEDTPWTIDQLRTEGFSGAVISGVDAVTRRERESYEDFCRRAALDPLGRIVKLADLRDNMDTSRLAELTERDHARLQKYGRAVQLITLIGGIEEWRSVR